MLRKTLLGAALLAFLGTVEAQPGVREAVTLELGFGGEIVAGRWNPLRLTTRDTPPAELYLNFDQSSFTEPETWAGYRASVSGGGVAVFEDDVFVPEWRQLTWRLVGAGRVLGSGSLGRARRDARPLTLLLSAQPFRWQGAFGPEERVVSLPAGALPERLAAYDGVATLLIDGTAPAPNPAAVVAATSAGVHTLLVEPLPPSHDGLLALTAATPRRLGAGWLERTADPDRVGEVVSGARETTFTPDAFATSLLAAVGVEKPRPPAQLPLVLVASGYALLVLVLLRFAGAPGLATAFVLAVLAGGTAWFYLRPPTPQTAQSGAVVTSGGALARRDEARSLFTLPRHTFALAGAARPLGGVAYTQTGERFEVALERWETVDLHLRPTLTDAALFWQGQTLHNATPTPLSDLFVVGLGPQPDLSADAELTPQPAPDAAPPRPYRELVMPPGSAVGRSGDTFYLALPQPTLVLSTPALPTLALPTLALPTPAPGSDARVGR